MCITHFNNERKKTHQTHCRFPLGMLCVRIFISWDRYWFYFFSSSFLVVSNGVLNFPKLLVGLFACVAKFKLLRSDNRYDGLYGKRTHFDGSTIQCEWNWSEKDKYIEKKRRAVDNPPKKGNEVEKCIHTAKSISCRSDNRME